MSTVLYFDCFSGAAGDMILGALIDAGLPVDELRRALGSLGVGHELGVTKVLRAGLSATYVEVVETAQSSHSHAHSHEHHHHHGRDDQHAHHGHDHAHDHSHSHDHSHHSLGEVAHLIAHCALSDAGKARALA
jgi:uncharacterized protein (DUF111 family)